MELPRNREDCQCCGGGGNLEMVDAALSADIAKAKIEEILATGAAGRGDLLPAVRRTMLTYVRRNKIPIEVMDIAQLVNRALKKTTS